MCGIIAMIAKDKFGFEYKSKAIFQQMLYANALRGQDSTGVFGINKHGNLKMVKSAQPAASFLNTKTAQDFLDKCYTDYRVMVGHNRATTKGATIDENAHPFIEGNTCLIHNGTLHAHKHLKDVEVDSHAICHAMEEQNYKEVLPELRGAFALIWYNAKEKILRIARNKERPLYIIETPKVDYIASEPDMVRWILDRNGITHGEAKYFDTAQIYSYHIDKLEEGFDTEKMPEKKSFPVVTVSVQRPLGRMVRGLLNNQKQETYGEVSSTNYSQYYKYGDQLILTHDSNTISNGRVIFRGKTQDKHQVPWCCTLDEKDVDLEMYNADTFFGRFSGASIRGSALTFMISPETLTEERMFMSINGINVRESQFYEKDLCDSCGAQIDPEEELFWVRAKRGRIKTLKCANCCDKDPNLKPIIDACLQGAC